ncbi:hypothetical protein HaLaN_10893, partial [Haematococcus lacustris]
MLIVEYLSELHAMLHACSCSLHIGTVGTRGQACALGHMLIGGLHRLSRQPLTFWHSGKHIVIHQIVKMAYTTELLGRAIHFLRWGGAHTTVPQQAAAAAGPLVACLAAACSPAG